MGAAEEEGRLSERGESKSYSNVVGEWGKQEVCSWEGDSPCPVFYIFCTARPEAAGKGETSSFSTNLCMVQRSTVPSTENCRRQPFC